MCNFNSRKGASRVVLGAILSTIIIGVGCGQNNHVTGSSSDPVDFDTLAQASSAPATLIAGQLGLQALMAKTALMVLMVKMA